jgi:hypothetical protein
MNFALGGAAGRRGSWAHKNKKADVEDSDSALSLFFEPPVSPAAPRNQEGSLATWRAAVPEGT